MIVPVEVVKFASLRSVQFKVTFRIRSGVFVEYYPSLGRLSGNRDPTRDSIQFILGLTLV